MISPMACTYDFCKALFKFDESFLRNNPVVRPDAHEVNIDKSNLTIIYALSKNGSNI